MNPSSNLRFAFSPSSYEPSFWEIVYDQKLNVYRLHAPQVPIVVKLSHANNKENATYHFANHSFEQSSRSGESIDGVWYNVNTIEEFGGLDKKAFLNDLGDKLILSNILSGKAVEDIGKLFGFGLLTFADLKGYKFVYWFCAPTIIPYQPIPYTISRPLISQKSLLQSLYSHILQTNHITPCQLFAIHYNPSTETIEQYYTFPEAWSRRKAGGKDMIWVVEDWSSSASGSVGTGIIGWNIRNLLALFAFHIPSDTSTATEWSRDDVNRIENIKLITLKNVSFFKHFYVLNPKYTLLCMLSQQKHPQDSVEDRVRLMEAWVTGDESVYYEISLQLSAFLAPDFLANHPMTVPIPSSVLPTTASSTIPSRYWQYVGWESNERGKAGARIADLSTTCNPLSHYQQAIDLNLKLMKWRQWPSMLLPEIQATKCLILGMGTLGCAVARTLLGYGIRSMTLVDNGRVSYSNPNRQCLYDFQDCLSRDYKAVLAKKKLLQIVPHCQESIHSVVLTIPMPGHPYHTTNTTSVSSATVTSDSSSATATATVTSGAAAAECLVDEAARRKLDELIADHDVIFLLTDSREARWLPTLLAKKHNKFLLNAALGFDTYVVMHHAYPTTTTTTTTTSTTSTTATTTVSSATITTATDTATATEDTTRTTLTSSGTSGGTGGGTGSGEVDGCYFCQDIVAATNSQLNKPLDEQCTVTRPGLSAIVAGYCTEMLIAYLHTTPTTPPTSAEGGGAGRVFHRADIPHQLRGSVYTFQQVTLQTPAFPYCTACSENIRIAYEQSPKEFVQQVCASASSLEEISGIRKMLESVDVGACIDSDEEF